MAGLPVTRRMLLFFATCDTGCVVKSGYISWMGPDRNDSPETQVSPGHSWSRTCHKPYRSLKCLS